MKEELLNEIKADYFERIEQNNRKKRCLEALKNRKSFLENSPTIAQFLDLQKQIAMYENDIHSDEYILEKLINCYADTINGKDTNGIFVYLGSFVYDMHNNEIQLDRNEKHLVPDYNLYGNIESADFVSIDYKDYKDFEEKNTILVTSNFPNIITFYEIRNEFFKNSIYESEEKAISKVLKRNTKK